MDKKIVIASSNIGKINEIKSILKDYQIISAKEAGFSDEIEETGNSFFENALIKAKTVATHLNMPALADDSGLCVDALKGAPGIYSARYSEKNSDESNIEKLLREMKGIKNRSAKFVCCMVYYDPKGKILVGKGETRGEILYKKEGDHGFGYDPIFYSLDIKKSMGTASDKEKNSVSHRYRAIKDLEQLLNL